MAKISISTTDSIKELFDSLKGEHTYSEVLSYLLSLNEPRADQNGTAKIETLLKKLLAFGHTRKITQTELQRVTGCNLKSIKDVIKLYEVEINEHNSSRKD